MKVIKHDETIKKIVLWETLFKYFFHIMILLRNLSPINYFNHSYIISPSTLIIKFENKSELENRCQVRR